ncbi:hypothetical protein SmJEL517_g01965 [Synchytrium microbalum]|uniref:LisH domain-containing protein n=1 Tax=Synchytrium microbalum TaxID=1806994 RepID=A0A507C8J2_9FUNG|nr:uncharacterized protein SmJEL517_g01965 [Synchytrium microbalum]TPX35648.1 hypothetical protein SmJEL517_g01965 [Synchytrium microbalum]
MAQNDKSAAHLTITSDQVNYLVYRYLLESGFTHSTFSFQQEAAIQKSEIKGALVRPGTLIAFLQKGLQYTEVETHINEDGSEKRCNAPFSLVLPHKCAILPDEPETRKRPVKPAPSQHQPSPQQSSNQPASAIPQQQQPSSSSSSSSTTNNNNGNNITSNNNNNAPPINIKPQPAIPPNQSNHRPSISGGGDSDKEVNTNKRERERTRKSDQGTGDRTNAKRIRRDAETGSPTNTNAPNKQNQSSNFDREDVIVDVMETNGDRMAIDLPEEPDYLTIPENAITRLEGHGGVVAACSWNSTYSASLATGSADGTTKIWSIPDRPGQLSQPPTTLVNKEGNIAETQHVISLDWNPGGDKLATGSMDGVARIWSRQGGLLHVFTKHTEPILSIKWNKKGDLLLTGCRDKSAIVWDSATGECRQQFEFHTDSVLDVDWKDDTTFATSSADHTIFVCQLGMLEPLQQFRGHDMDVSSIKWDPTYTYLASGSEDKTAKVWHIDQEEPYRDFRDHAGEVYTVRWSPGSGTMQRDGIKPRLLATASFDTTARIWDVDKGTCLYSFAKHTGDIYGLSFSPGGLFLATGSQDGTIKVWSMKDGSLLKNVDAQGLIYDIAWNSRGDKLAAIFSNIGHVMIAHLPASVLNAR